MKSLSLLSRPRHAKVLDKTLAFETNSPWFSVDVEQELDATTEVRLVGVDVFYQEEFYQGKQFGGIG